MKKSSKTKNSAENFILKISDINVARKWLYLAIFAITGAGLFSLPPVIMRKSIFKDPAIAEKIFTTSLIIHVNLSVMVWMLAIIGLLWSLLNPRSLQGVAKIPPFVCMIGAVLITISPFIGESLPLKNNYVPMLVNDVFKIGLALFLAGIFAQAVFTLLGYKFMQKPLSIKYSQRFAIYSSALIFMAAFACYIVANIQIRNISYENLQYYYETLFWSFGHILQFVFIQVLILMWLWLAEAAGLKVKISPRVLMLMLFFNLAFTLPVPLIFAKYNVDSPEIIGFFTTHMIYFGGIIAGIMALIVFLSILLHVEQSKKVRKNQDNRANLGGFYEKSALLFSLILFSMGGILGLLITGNDATVPAHYHGSIVGISIGMMGLVYNILPRLNFKRVEGKIVNLQPVIYGVGQMLHITGLSVMGGYGALRKAPGTIENINTTAGKIMFFSGGGLAIIGGLIFAVIAIYSICRPLKNSKK